MRKLFLCKVENQLGTYSPDVCLVVVAVDDWASMDQVSCSDMFWDLLDLKPREARRRINLFDCLLCHCQHISINVIVMQYKWDAPCFPQSAKVLHKTCQTLEKEPRFWIHGEGKFNFFYQIWNQFKRARALGRALSEFRLTWIVPAVIAHFQYISVKIQSFCPSKGSHGTNHTAWNILYLV